MFVDKVKIELKAGSGGNGLVSMRREKFVPLGGPDGGDGGNGGNIIFKADSNKSTLLDMRYNKKIFAEDGHVGKAKKMHGRSGEDIIVSVPVGTVVRDLASNNVIADFVEHDQEAVIARGGRGGRGNFSFKSNKYPAPDFSENGQPGERLKVEVELKLLADVGLVGFPSVGKSTFLSVVSRARPEIADYHFTTLVPNLGVSQAPDGRSFVVADLPGLIEGASQGKGLGHQFLRHIERTRVIVHIIDMGAEDMRDPLEDYEIINNELASYQYHLLERPQVIVANKMDLEGAQDNLKRFKEAYPELKVFETTTIFQEGIDLVLYEIADLLEETPEFPLIDDEGQQGVVYKFEQDEEGFYVNNLGHGRFELVGDELIKEFEMIDFNHEGAALHFAKVMKDMGVDARLRELGAKDGDTVYIKDFVFEFID